MLALLSEDASSCRYRCSHTPSVALSSLIVLTGTSTPFQALFRSTFLLPPFEWVSLYGCCNDSRSVRSEST